MLAIAAMLLGGAIVLRLLLPGSPVWAPPLILLSAIAMVVVAFAPRASTCANAAPASQRRYTRRMLMGTGSYVLLLSISILWLLRIEAPALRALVALLPVAPVALMLRTMVQFIREVDELQQRIELEAICIAAGLVSLLYMTGGFLQAAGVIDVPVSAAMFWVFPLVCVTYGIAKSVVARRFR